VPDCTVPDSTVPDSTGPVAVSRFAHIRLTVGDLARSRTCYDRVLGVPVALEVREDADEATRKHPAFLFGGLVYAIPARPAGSAPWN
jgi:glyoxylase I family protein